MTLLPEHLRRPPTMAGRIATLQAMLDTVDEDGNPAPLISREEVLKLLEAPQPPQEATRDEPLGVLIPAYANLVDDLRRRLWELREPFTHGLESYHLRTLRNDVVKLQVLWHRIQAAKASRSLQEASDDEPTQG